VGTSPEPSCRGSPTPRPDRWEQGASGDRLLGAIDGVVGPANSQARVRSISAAPGLVCEGSPLRRSRAVPRDTGGPTSWSRTDLGPKPPRPPSTARSTSVNGDGYIIVGSVAGPAGKRRPLSSPSGSSSPGFHPALALVGCGLTPPRPGFEGRPAHGLDPAVSAEPDFFVIDVVSRRKWTGSGGRRGETAVVSDRGGTGKRARVFALMASGGNTDRTGGPRRTPGWAFLCRRPEQPFIGSEVVSNGRQSGIFPEGTPTAWRPTTVAFFGRDRVFFFFFWLSG